MQLFKTKSPEPFPLHELEDRLDQILSAGEKAGIAKRTIAEILQRRAEDFAKRDALAVNLGGSPSVVYHDGFGRSL